MALYLSNIINLDSGVFIPPKTEVVSAAKTLTSNGPIYFVDTSAGSFTLTLPTPNLNDRISIYDTTGSFETNPLTISRNGSLIIGVSEDLSMDVNNAKTELVYVGGSLGWSVYLG